MSSSLPSLLITATLDAGKTPQVALQGIRERTLRHMEGLLAWLKDPAINQVVFTKNCTAQIRPKILIEAAADYGKELEFIQTDSSPRTLLQGKGYGEGDIIRQVLEKSTFLRDAEEFLKVTGKLYAPNAEHFFPGAGDGEFLLSSGEDLTSPEYWRRSMLGPCYQNETACSLFGFLRRNLRIPWGLLAAPVIGRVDTRIYRVRRTFYQENLLNAYRRVNDSLGYTLEAVFYDELGNLPAIHFIRPEPIILGTSGTLGTTAGVYSTQIQEESRELTSKLLVSP